MVKSLMVCAGLQKCSATPDDFSSFLLIVSRWCSLNLSFSRLLVCPMYWQFLFPLCRQRLHCNAYMTLVELQSSRCFMSLFCAFCLHL